MTLASFPQRLDLSLLSVLLREECLQSHQQPLCHTKFTTDLGELDTLRLHCSNRLRAPVEERLSHRWLIGTLRLSIKPVISCLERHLNKRIRGESMINHPVATVSLELKRLTIVLANQVRNACLGKPDACAQLRGEVPLKFLGRGIEDFWRFTVTVAVTAVVLWRLVGLGVWRELGFKEGRSGGVDGTCHQHETFSEDVRCEAKDGMTVNASVFKIDTCHAVSANDNLQLWESEFGYDQPIESPHLVVPPVRASADLNAITELVRPAEVIRAQLGLVLGGEVVEAYHE